MKSHFMKLEMQKIDDVVRVKPGEIMSIAPASEGGSRIVTRQNQVFYVKEYPEDIETKIILFFEEMNERF